MADNKCGTKSSSRRKTHGFTTKCASLIKEQRARIYILRRCATMLLCWPHRSIICWSGVLYLYIIFSWSAIPLFFTQLRGRH
uniref:Uncharacterized protein n=1 Tax=Manihot esculenta TaxID=3983 RepID=A0A2C9UZB0_MANES